MYMIDRQVRLINDCNIFLEDIFKSFSGIGLIGTIKSVGLHGFVVMLDTHSINGFAYDQHYAICTENDIEFI